jgi:hypothetical protein
MAEILPALKKLAKASVRSDSFTSQFELTCRDLRTTISSRSVYIPSSREYHLFRDQTADCNRTTDVLLIKYVHISEIRAINTDG